MQTITKIVLTGGPCAGKTTAMSWIQNAFSARGYKVIFIPETATELISGGVAPWSCGTNLDYQICQMRLQMFKEEIFTEAAKTMPDEKILIVCDRGMMDNYVYMTDDEFRIVLDKIHQNEADVRDCYGAVFHLVSSAKGTPDIYIENCKNNPARIETVEQATALDDKLIAAWTGHPHFRVIDNSTNFENKMKRLIYEIAVFLGEPVSYEAKRKFLIEYPDIDRLERGMDCRKIEIIQTYLKTDGNEEVRVCKRGMNGDNVYFKITKKNITPTTPIEIEKRLSKKEYLSLLMTVDSSLRQICKSRYRLSYDGRNFDIDVFPFWQDKAIVEIELPDEETVVRFPDFIKVIKEVTDDENYKNLTLARRDWLG